MDSVPLSQPSPSHSNPRTPLRHRALLNSIFHGSRNEPHTNDQAVGPYSMIDDGSSGRGRSRAGSGSLGQHIEHLGGRIAALSSRSHSRACSDRITWHYTSNGSYVPVQSHPGRTERASDGQRPSASETTRSGQNGRNRRSQSRRQRQRSEVPTRSCTSIIGQQTLRKKLYTLIIAGLFFLVVLAVCEFSSL